MHLIFVRLTTDTGQCINVVFARQGQLKFQHTKYTSVEIDLYLHRCTSVLICYPLREGTRKVQRSCTASGSNKCQVTYNGEVCDGQV